MKWWSVYWIMDIMNHEKQKSFMVCVTLGRSNSKFKLIVGATRKIEGCRDLK